MIYHIRCICQLGGLPINNWSGFVGSGPAPWYNVAWDCSFWPSDITECGLGWLVSGWCIYVACFIYMVNHGSLFCSDLNPIYVDLIQLRHLRHLRFCFQFYKPFAGLWSVPAVFFFCAKMASLEMFDMYFDELCVLWYERDRFADENNLGLLVVAWCHHRMWLRIRNNRKGIFPRIYYPTPPNTPLPPPPHQQTKYGCNCI
jgi:hypothetical protein